MRAGVEHAVECRLNPLLLVVHRQHQERVELARQARRHRGGPDLTGVRSTVRSDGLIAIGLLVLATRWKRQEIWLTTGGSYSSSSSWG
jgi:hypothetical protein